MTIDITIGIDLSNATIDGEPVTHADIDKVGAGYSASVGTQSRYFSEIMFYDRDAGRRFILSKLDGFVDEVQQEALDLVSKFGPFVLKKERDVITLYTSMASREEGYSRKKLQAAIDSIAARSKAVREGAAKLPSLPRTMSDAQVVAGIRYLTGLDADRAAKANRVGWSNAHSQLGHWACAHLDTYPAEAIAVARQFIDRYLGQLRTGGIV
ncbi:MAG TPA: hypothetical protein VIL88_02460 [Devosia sp.]|jgi:hypothetical protein|uniref:hypothetical protein n=1 Tax=Devosia sp. TaxID=1871048 RepID=UPI002F94E4D2